MLILKNYIITSNKENIISATIEEGDNIAALTFFVAKPQKKGKFAISLQQSEEGGSNCRLLLQYKVLAFFATQLLNRKMKGNCSCAAPQQAEEGLRRAAVAAQKKKQNKKATLSSPSSLCYIAKLCTATLQRSAVLQRTAMRSVALHGSIATCCNVTQQN